METFKIKGVTASIITSILFLFLATSLSAYEPTTTHAGLSQEIVEFYNLNYPRKITKQESELIIRGSMDEDDPAYRALNHFFDPVRNIGFNNGHTAKNWAFSPILQKHDALAGSGDQDFSWPRALEDYASGKEERAILALGHVIHLLEDMSVPDHTRNDPHKGDAITHNSPYETWTSLNKNRTTMRGLATSHFTKGDRPREQVTGEALFDFIANYSSRNFFSLDTISDRPFQYIEPKIEKFDDQYVYGSDDLLVEQHKLLKYRKLDGLNKEYLLDSDTDHSVLSDYFDRLARQNIRAGAGLIHLFLTEAAQARKAYQLKIIEEQGRVAEQARAARARVEKYGAVGSLTNLISASLLSPLRRSLVNTGGNVSRGLSVVYYRTTQNFSNVLAVAGFTGNLVTTEVAESQARALKQLPSGSLTVGPAFFIISKPESKVKDKPVTSANPVIVPVPPVVGFPEVTLRVIANDTIAPPIKPVQEAVGEASAQGNFVNVAPSPPAALGPAPQIEVVETGSGPNAYQPGFGGGGGGGGAGTVIVIGAAADTTAPDISLAVSQCNNSLAVSACLLATTTVEVSWSSSAGDLAHFTFAYSDGSATTTTNTNATSQQLTVADNKTYRLEVGAYDTAGNVATSTLFAFDINLHPVVINEIAWAGSAASALDEWLELRNVTAHTIALTSMVLESTDGTPSIALVGNIVPSGFFLLERRDDETVSNIAADFIYGDGGALWSLRNDGEELRLLHILGSAITTLDSTPDLADCNGIWCAGEGSPTFRSMQRKANGDYDSYALSTSNALDRDGNTLFGTPRAVNNFDFDAPPPE